MDQEFWYGLVFGFGVLVLGTILLVVILIQGGSFQRAKIARREQAADRELIARYEELTEATSTAQQQTAEDLADVRRRVAEIERMIREVD